MKKYFKILSLFAVLACFTACDDSSDLATPVENIGWIQFTGTLDDPTVFQYQQSFDVTSRVGVNIQVPVVENDLMIGYDLVSVSGLDPNTFSNSGTLMSPAGESSIFGPDNNTGIEYSYLADIVFDLAELPTLTEPMVFDVVLQSVNDSNITVGFNDEKPVSQRVTICPAAENLFLGDYTITSDGDNVAGNSFGPATVTIVEGADGPLSRTFDATYLPNFGIPYTVTFMITADGIANTSGDINPGLACGGVDNAPGMVGIGFGANPELSSLTCGDSEFTLNAFEFKYTGDDPDDVDDVADLIGSGGCVDDFDDMNTELTIILTKI